MPKMKRAAPPKRNMIPTGAVQKQGGGVWQNTKLPLRPELQAALRMKSQSTRETND